MSANPSNKQRSSTPALTAPTLQIQLLGGFQIQYGDTLVTAISSPRLQSLLAYLLLNARTPLARRQLAFQLWPDKNEKQARGNLRRELHTLRHKLPDAEQFIQIEQHFVLWRSDGPYTLDVLEFAADITAANATTNPADVAAALTRAVDRYLGPLFPDCYDEWIWPEREALAQEFSQALHRLIQVLEDDRAYTGAIAYAERLLRHDPLVEQTYRTLMRLHALNDDRAGALRIYHSCTTMLARELDVPPAPETEQLYRQIVKADQRETDAPAASRSRPLQTTLVGRTEEWSQLCRLWKQTQNGRAHFVLISGEAGIGKSQLTEEFARWVERLGGAVATTHAYEMEAGLAYQPIIEWLRSDLLQPVVVRMDDVWLVELARLLPELLTERPALPHPQPMTESRQRQRLFESLARVLQAVDEPLLLLLDDMHWSDQETAMWLQYLFSVWADIPLLLVATIRPEEVPNDHPAPTLWRDLRSQLRISEMSLQPLRESEIHTLANQIAGQELDAATLAQLYTETEGIPLFLVELVRSRMWDRSGNDERLHAAASYPLNSLSPVGKQTPSLPPQIQAVIEARLSRLSAPARRLAELAATIGRSFSYDLLVQASGDGEDTLVDALDELWQRRIICENGAYAYQFSHELIRQVTYNTLSTIRCRQLHRQVATALYDLNPNNLTAVNAQIAYHYDNAACPEEAIEFYLHAAQTARERFANENAVALLSRALTICQDLPDSSTQRQQELTLYVALGSTLQAARGIGAAEAKAIYEQGYALAQRMAATEPQFPALWGLWAYYFTTAEHKTADEVGMRLLHWAQAMASSSLQLQAFHASWTSAFALGRFQEAEQYCAQGWQLFNQDEHHVMLYQYGGHDAGLCSLCFHAVTLWLLGFPDQARARCQQALELGERFTHPTSKAQPLYWMAILHQLLGKTDEVGALALAAGTLAKEKQVLIWSGWDSCLLGWVTAQRGDPSTGLAQITEGLEATGSNRLLCTYFLSLLATGQGQRQEVATALEVLETAFQAVDVTGERWWLAELHRLQGDLLLTKGDAAAAEDAYQQAIHVAQSQQAKLLELRAILHLCRLWQQQGKYTEAHTRLSAIYNWFTEGFDTADLQEAQTLLSGLVRRS
ncbi:MAG: AAA family ATPase [Caldilineaceae bacterium]